MENSEHLIFLQMSKISDLPLESFLNYIHLDQNLEEESNDLLEHIHMLRGKYNLKNIMGIFVNKVKRLKDEIVNKVVHAAKDVVVVNKEVLANMVKVFKDVTKNVKNGAQIVEIVEVTYDIVLYTNITINNLYRNDPNYEKEADHIYKKITGEISNGEKILRNNENEEKDLRLYFDEINRQMYSLESDLKVIVQKAKEIRKAMVEIIELKPMLEAKFKHSKIQKIR